MSTRLLISLVFLASCGPNLLHAGCGGAASEVKTATTVAASPATRTPAAPADPLADAQLRFPPQHFLTARGQGPTAEVAREDAQRKLLESIQTRVRGVEIKPPTCTEPGCAETEQAVTQGLVKEIPPFKHAALIRTTDAVAVEGGFVILASLRRDEVAPLLEQDVRTAREELEAWRKQMIAGLAAQNRQALVRLCGEPVGPVLRRLEQLRLSQAVITRDETSYTPSDDLKSVLEIGIRTRALLAETPTTLVLQGTGGDAQTAERMASMVLEHLVARGLRAQRADRPGKTGLLFTLKPELTWSQDSFHFLRSGAEIQGRFAEVAEAFLQVNVDGNLTKGGGVQKPHAVRESMAKFEKLLTEKLDPKLPDLSCQVSW